MYLFINFCDRKNKPESRKLNTKYCNTFDLSTRKFSKQNFSFNLLLGSSKWPRKEGDLYFFKVHRHNQLLFKNF